MTGICADCREAIDPKRAISVRIYKRDRRGKDHELCLDCWRNDAKAVSK